MIYSQSYDIISIRQSQRTPIKLRFQGRKLRGRHPNMDVLEEFIPCFIKLGSRVANERVGGEFEVARVEVDDVEVVADGFTRWCWEAC